MLDEILRVGGGSGGGDEYRCNMSALRLVRQEPLVKVRLDYVYSVRGKKCSVNEKIVLLFCDICDSSARSCARR